MRDRGDPGGKAGGSRRAAASAAVAEAARPARPKGNSLGFIEPEPWPYDGGKRRESVLVDLEYFPPRVVRKVGWRNCMCCGKPFWSEDTTRLRLCDGDTGCRDQTPVRYRKAATDQGDATRSSARTCHPRRGIAFSSPLNPTDAGGARFLLTRVTCPAPSPCGGGAFTSGGYKCATSALCGSTLAAAICTHVAAL